MSRRQEAAIRISQHARKQAFRAQQVHRAEVTSLSPLTVARLGTDQVLAVDEDFDLSGTLRLLVKTTPLKLGDNLLMHRYQGHWAAFDVLTDSVI